MPYDYDRHDDRFNAWDGVDNWAEQCPDDDEAAAAWMAAHYPDDDAAAWADAADGSDVIDPTIY